MKNLLGRAIWMAPASLCLMVPNPVEAQSVERPRLTAQQCQPLTADNADICCIALNRNELLTDEELDQCPPLTTARIRTVVDEFDSDETNPPTGTVPSDDPDDPDDPGQDPGGDPGTETTKANSGAGNGGESGAGEHESSDPDPGNSGGHNNSPDSPGGRN
jgi:hypothetical protein